MNLKQCGLEPAGAGADRRLINLSRPSSCSGAGCRRAPALCSSMLCARRCLQHVIAPRAAAIACPIVKVISEQFAETSETPPEILAHRYTEAGLVKPAVMHWRQAGERARRRWANVEAVKHLPGRSSCSRHRRCGRSAIDWNPGSTRHWATRWGRSKDTMRRKSRRCIPAPRPSSITAPP